ncbi:membrane dipeptidase [Leptospira haakeii]|uniref:Peptidase M19 n=1 Tax=Leptospira haakeii TaxID=2023198 RepID=A0ABX4PHI2_9LEPT|nr:membrane dipeptidase [Leptospira haakeii]PKA14385.1 peptidase M19 [Leptospira haakeii]PKA19665.1 peptidase M19 [Leptospira haakeii]
MNYRSIRRSVRGFVVCTMFFAGSVSVFADPYWGTFKKDSCTSIFPGKRQYSAILYGIPSGQSWETTCANMGATINGQVFTKPSRCKNTGLNMWGEFDVLDDSCEANWSATDDGGAYNWTHKNDGCQTSGTYAGKRKYSSRIWNVVGITWEAACAQLPITIAGKTYTTPTKCVNTGTTGMWGEWYVADSSCESAPKAYARGAQDSLKRTGTLSGYVDLHTHPMAHLGFGGVIFHGAPYGEPATALADCPSMSNEGHSAGHSRVEAIVQDDIIGALLSTAKHDNRGYASFPYWPANNSYTHQTMYYEWIKRAYEGGLRTMVVLAVNGDYMFGATDNGLPDIIKGIAIATDPVYDLNDMNTLRRQTQAVYDMQTWIDQKSGGAGLGWFRIVKSPSEAQSVIAAGKLAVVLGAEVDYLVDCTTTTCTDSMITQGVQAMYDAGLRYIFPIHLKTNGFGGAGLYNILGSGTKYDCKHYGQDCNTAGLTSYGPKIMKALMQKGMIIDVGHMSARSLEGALTYAEQQSYPGIVTGHTGVYDMANKGNRHEANPTGAALKRIIALGGMIGLIPGQGNLDEVGEWRQNSDGSYISHACGGTTQTFAQSYQYLRNLIGDQAYDGRISVGTDFNGFAHMPGPRYGTRACPGGVSTIAQPDSAKVGYPFAPDASIRKAATLSALPSLGKYTFGNRTFDFNTEGASHIGLMPDFFEDLRQQGLKRSDLEPVYRSADFFTTMWQNAVTRGASIQ